MDFKETWEGDGFSVSVFVSDALLYMKLTGIVGIQAYYQGAAYAAGVASQKPFAAQLTDLRRALLTATESDLMGLKVPRSALSATWRPGAYIVPHEFETQYKRLAWRLAQQGLERVVFTSGSAALAWAKQAAMRARVRSALQASAALTRMQGQPHPLEFGPSAPGAL